MTGKKDIPSDQDSTDKTAHSTSVNIQPRDPEGRAPTSNSQSNTPRFDSIDLTSIPNSTNVTPPRDLEGEGSWEQSPLDVAIRRRLFPRARFDSTANTGLFGHKRFSPSEARSHATSVTLYDSDNLQDTDSKSTDTETKAPSSPTSVKADTGSLNPQFSTPATKGKGKWTTPRIEAGSIEKGKPSPQISTRSRSSLNFVCPRVDAQDPRRPLKHLSLISQRTVFSLLIFVMNAACLVGALESNRHLWVLIVILLVKAKEILSTLLQIGWVTMICCRSHEKEEQNASGKWILACVTAYAETEEQIMRTINSVIDNAPKEYHTAMVIILDGKPQEILGHFTRVFQKVRRPYQTWRYAYNEVNLYTGIVKRMPVFMFEKIGNAGKKDSLILCHDLFNHMRDDAPGPTKELREEIWTKFIPQMIATDVPQRFDFLFFTDADSLIYDQTLIRLAEALTEEPDSIAACGVLLAEMRPGRDWSMWYLYQQFQYTYGQYIRRRAEGIWGRVTCLPGCVTMIKNRPEMAGAIALYASPIMDRLVLQHQVQYLGTDRRITWSMLEQSKHLKTLFVPEAISQTAAPEGLLHYMSQRRRWGSNAYFNDFLYIFGRKSWLITRLWAFIDIIRQTLVYYRLANTIMFIYGLSRHFLIIKLVPYIVVTQLPVIWFCLIVLREPILRKQAHKLFAGWLINKIVSPIFAIMIFSRILWNIGNTAWGRTGAEIQDISALDILHALTPNRSWTPTGIKSLVRDTIKGRTKKTTRVRSKLVPLEYGGRREQTSSASRIKRNERLGAAPWTSSSMPNSPLGIHIPFNGDGGSQETVKRNLTPKVNKS